MVRRSRQERRTIVDSATVSRCRSSARPASVSDRVCRGAAAAPGSRCRLTSGRAANWTATARWLTRYGRIVGYDARGHGHSDRPDGPYDRPAYVGDAVAVIEALDLAPALVVGHSMGGLTAWQLAGARPDLVRGVVIADMNPVTPPDLVERRRRWLAHWADRDHRAELAGVGCPALVVAGAETDQSVARQREMADLLPDGRYALVPDAGHVLHYDNPAGWRVAVEPFVARLTPAHATA